MNVSRENVSVGLYNLLNSGLASLLQNGTLKTFTRQPRIWTDVNAPEKPFLTLFKGGPETEQFVQPQQAHIGLTKYRIHYNLWLYVVSDPSNQTLAETVVNNIADGIDAAMQAGAYGERQTLNGLVNNAWIDGGADWAVPTLVDNNSCLFLKIAVETGI